MKKSNLYKALAASALLSTAMVANAKTETYSVGFVTIQDLTITQDQALSFGQNIIGKAGTTCTLTFAENVTTTTTTKAAPSNFNDGLSGNGCLEVAGGATPTTTSNLAGVYTVSGAAGQTVNLTVASITGSDFNFTPSAKAITDGADINVAGSFVDVFADSAQSDALGAGAANNLVLVVGGTLTVGSADLDANKPYSGSFTITATY